MVGFTPGDKPNELTLVDELGNLQDAVAFAASTLGIIGKPKVVQERRERLWWQKFVLKSLPGYSMIHSWLAVEAVRQYRWLY